MIDAIEYIRAGLGFAPRDLKPGKFVRFGVRQSGWAKLFDDGLGVAFGCYRQGISTHVQLRQPKSEAERERLKQQIAQAAAERETAQKAEWAKNAMKNAEMWAAATPAGDAVRGYLAARGLADWTIPAVIRQATLPHWHTTDDGELVNMGMYPVMLAPIAKDGKLLALHRTYLGDGCKADVPTPRKLTAAAGHIGGACIPLAQPVNGEIGVAEGVETAASAFLMHGVATVAAYAANALKGFHWPKGIKRLVIYGDNDDAGKEAADALAMRAIKYGIRAHIEVPHTPGFDWNDALLKGGC